MAIFNHLLDRQARSWFWPSVPVLSAVNPVLSLWPLGGSPLSPLSPLYGRGFWICGRDTCVFFSAYSVSREAYRFILVTEVTAVMKTIICSETLQLPTGPQLRAFSQTECQD
jgi:hypothetical protein